MRRTWVDDEKVSESGGRTYIGDDKVEISRGGNVYIGNERVS